jgi:hypothetical protein
MKGLIIKDLLVTRRAIKKEMILIYLGLIVFLIYQGKEMAGGMIAAFMLMLAGMSVTTTLNLDEASGWRRTERLLPLSVEERVGVKYLLLLVFLLALSPVLILIGFILPLIYPSASLQDIPMMLGILWGASMVYNAISLPVTYRFGTKARIVLMMLMIMPATYLISSSQTGSIAVFPASLPLSPALLAGLAMLTAVALLGLSSLKLYKRTLE